MSSKGEYNSVGLMQDEDKGPSMITFTGRKIYPLQLTENDILIEDVAHALSMQCRYNGHCLKFESVAEHSVYVSIICDQLFSMEGLLHDTAEYILGDMIRPLKVTEDLGAAYKKYEHYVETIIARKFGLTFPFPATIKEADNQVLFAERRDNIVKHNTPWYNPDGVKPMKFKIQCWAPEQAEKMFLKRYEEIRQLKDA